MTSENDESLPPALRKTPESSLNYYRSLQKHPELARAFGFTSERLNEETRIAEKAARVAGVDTSVQSDHASWCEGCKKEVHSIWREDTAYCPSCGRSFAQMAQDRDDPIRAVERADARRKVARAAGLSAGFAIAVVLLWNLLFVGDRVTDAERVSDSIIVALLGLLAAVMANRISLGKEIAAWLLKRRTFRDADAVVLAIARTHDVFVQPFESSTAATSWFPGRTIYFRTYDFRRVTLQIRMPLDGMIEIAAMAPISHGGGCMYPPPSAWSMRNSHCGQGYRLPNAEWNQFLARLREVAEWIVADSETALAPRPVGGRG